jgi:hypothetical protein
MELTITLTRDWTEAVKKADVEAFRLEVTELDSS